MKKFDYWVECYEIHPPIGGQIGWGAKANVKKTGTGRVDDFVTLSEHLGKTRDEAYAKANAEARDWIGQKTAAE